MEQNKYISDTLSVSKMGLWTIILNEGEPKFIIDAITASLVGCDSNASPEEAYKYWYSHVDSDYIVNVNDCVDKIIQGEQCEVIYPYHHPTLGTITIRCGGVLETDYSGTGIKMRGYHQNISEYNTALLDQMEISSAMQQLFTSVFQISIENDTYRLLSDTNKCFGHLEREGCFSENFKKLSEYVTEDTRQVFDEFTNISTLKDRIANKESIYCEIRSKRLGWHRLIIIVSNKNNSSKNKYLLIMQNINEEKALENQVIEATINANLAKSDFLSRMSHDLRTPLNTIIGLTTIASSHINENERVNDCLSKIAVSSKLLLGLVNDIVDISMLESGKEKLIEDKFELSKLVDNILSMARIQSAPKNQDLIFSIENIEHESVIGDSYRIQQIFMNLISNSVKYSPANTKLSITISEKPHNVSGIGCYVVTFKDNGIGMDEDTLNNLFTPFYRSDDVRVKKEHGSGLGMTLTQKLVQMMNGNIKIESAINKGTTVYVTLYLKLQENEEYEIEDYFKDLPILLVDDNFFTLEVHSKLFKELGMLPDTSISGQDAIDIITSQHQNGNDYFAIFIDWIMPDMDGIQTAKAIRDHFGPDIPIILTTNYDWHEIEQEARANGVNNFVSKPLFKSRIVKIIKALKANSYNSKITSVQSFAKVDYSKVHALMVDDNELNAEIATEILSMTGMKIDRVVNGKEAVDKIISVTDGYYDIIFMDIQMPVMNGYEATKAIRALPGYYPKKVPILAMTANTFPEDIAASKNAGMNEHLAKPLELNKLLSALQRWL